MDIPIKIMQGGNCLTIQSHINSDVFNSVDSDKLEIINVQESVLDENDLKIINGYFKINKKPRLQVENWQIPFLPEVESFLIWYYSEEAIDLLSNNTVRKLTFVHEQETKKKSDLTKLLIFKDTLEKLYFAHGGNYTNLEITLNGLKKLKTLALEGFKIDRNIHLGRTN